MKAYTTFAVKAHDPVKSLHVTHSYFGEVTPEEVVTITRILDAWFLIHPFERFTYVFDRLDHFGPLLNIKVLRPTERDAPGVDNWLMDLRLILQRVTKRCFDMFAPHLTIEPPYECFRSAQADFDNFVLVIDKQIVWRARGN